MHKIHSDVKSLYQAVIDMLEERLDDLKDCPTEAVRLADFDLGAFDFNRSFDQVSIDGLKEKSQMLLLSHLQLQNTPNPRGMLLQLGKALKGDGLLMMSLLGQESLHEFKTSFAAIEEERGMPLPDVRDIGGLLNNLQFALPVVDRDIVTLSYPDFKSMYADMKLLGLKNTSVASYCTKSQWQKMEAYYKEHFTNEDGQLEMSIELIFAMAYRPHKSQPQPLKRGSAVISMVDALDAEQKENPSS